MGLTKKDITKTMRRKKEKFGLPLITLSVLIAILCIASVARGSVRIKNPPDIPAFAENPELFEEEGLDTYEINVLDMLKHSMDFMDEKTEAESSPFLIYYNLLKCHFVNTQDDITVKKLEPLIEELRGVMQLEASNDFRSMSLDGRRVAIYLSKEIYQYCGLSIEFNLNGEIEQIKNIDGNEIYAGNEMDQERMHMEALAIAMGIILILLLASIYIARKNKLFVKEVVYDGFDEKGFA